MNTRIFATKVTVSSALAIALALGTTSIAVAQPNAMHGDSSAVLSVDELQGVESVDLDAEEIDAVAADIETLFSVYLSQNKSGKWYITQSGMESEVPQSDLAVIVSMLNGDTRFAGSAGNTTRSLSPYAQCIIDASGLGALGGLFSGAIGSLIERGLWKEAAIKIVKIVGKNAIKGGVVGLAAMLAGSAIWCLTPWSK
ncbi:MULTISPECIES: hypothetical protein [Actinomycetaceae]|uniref:TPM domain-containing protein n=2 Tax=Actinomycetaceae TaxID=2049 RepID=A0ABZ0RB03_9ACTO|nr:MULTISPECIES: hypothetical protein [Actinotignum]WPJ89034.1 hypothetical protein R0V15_00090 [Schaalia turicensis]MDE1553450.1 hypothetical protein [Actinotignum sanguinis]MDE1566225.1 hypothetical protein [Actinotignum sanguinis]MDE1577954.1 hypothetical protein [Actinotignum sanguinis]MDE1642713.1 hypothetical protein [Actinotignum sanguinis]